MNTAFPWPLVVIAGATASGKTALAVDLAAELPAEIVGADSVQVYRGLDVGSAKPSHEELRGVPHHLLDVVALDEPFDAARYAALADAAISEIRARGRVPLVVGGTGLYLRALVRGLAEGIAGDATVRAALNARAAEGRDALRAMHAELAVVDPAYAARVQPTDPIRIVRALEVYQLTGEAISVHHARHAQRTPRYRALFLALETDRATLRARITARTRDMIARGWEGEVRGILAAGFDPALRPLRSVGYAEMVRHVVGGHAMDQTEAAIVSATVAFAKRQRTWFRGERDVNWVTADALRSAAWRERLRAHLTDA